MQILKARRRWVPGVGLLVWITLATPVTRAADAETESLKIQMQALITRIEAQERELAELKDAQRALLERLEKKATPAPPAAPITAAAVPETRNSLADHLKIGGYGSVRFETNDAPGSAAGFTFRRFVLTTDARLSSRLRVHSETEFERLHSIEVEKKVNAGGGLELEQTVEGNSGGEISMEQMWGQYNFAENHGIRAGVVLPPLGRFNILHDDDYWDLPRRTLVDRDAAVIPVKSAWRELGAGLVGGFNLGRGAKLDYEFYLLNGATLDFNLESALRPGGVVGSIGEFELTSGAFDGSQKARAIAWRTSLSPTLAGEFAFSGYHGRYTPNYLGAGEPLNSLGFDYKWRHRAFEIEGEAIYSSFGRTRRVLEAFARTALDSETAATELELTGLARTRYGFWNDFKYNWRPAFLKRSFLGRTFDDPRLIPILRYERVWLNDMVEELAFQNGAITDLDMDNLAQERISLGLSYRPMRSFGIQFAYEHNRRVKGRQLIFPRVPVNATNGLLTGMVFSF